MKVELKNEVADKVTTTNPIKKSRGHHSSKRVGSKLTERTAVNSPEFWNKVPGLLGAAGRIPSTTPFVTKQSGYGSKFATTSNVGQQNQLAAVRWIPSIGPAVGDISDPINTAAQQLYTYIRQNVSGSRTYEAADLIQYITAVYNLHAYLAYLKLLYGSTDIVHPLNRDIARTIVYSLGYDYDNIVAHKADLLFLINNFTYKLAQFPVPAGWSCLEHWKLLLSGIFTDRYVASLKNQFYLFVMGGVYYYDWANAALKLRPLPESGDSDVFSTIVTDSTAIMTALMNNTDIQVMSSDILRVFGNNLEQVAPITPDYMLKFNVTSNEMLNQIRNMEFFTMHDPTQFNITQSGSSTLEYGDANNGHPQVTLTTFNSATPCTNAKSDFDNIYGSGKCLIAYEPDLSPDAIMVATRMMVHYETEVDATPATKLFANLISWGVEVFLGIEFVKFTAGIYEVRPWISQVCHNYNSNDPVALECARCEFEGAPKLFYLNINYSAGAYRIGGAMDMFALDNFLLISNSSLDDLHYAAVQSSFYVPLASAKTI